MPTPLDYRPRNVPDDKPPGRPRGKGLLARAFRTTVVGTVIGFAATIGLYAFTGGWGPPDNGLLTVAGFVLGILDGVGTVPKDPST